jgi:glycosyltransferase involved in cell wall biosynthesis
MRLLYLTRGYTVHDARWLSALSPAVSALGFLALAGGETARVPRDFPSVEVLVSPRLGPERDSLALDAALPDIAAEWRRFAPDVVLAGPLTDAGYVATRIDPSRTILMSWGFDVFREPVLDPIAFNRLCAALGSGAPLFADCEAVASHCDAVAGLRLRRACVLPWGLAPEDMPRPRAGRDQRRDSSSTVVLGVRGFEAVHRPLLLIEAFRRAHLADRSLRLWLAGEGSLRGAAERAVTEAGLGSCVRFLGFLDQADLADRFAQADLYLSASECDGTSLSLLQAMHAGLPCVVSELPSNREWLGEDGGRFGRDAETFARQILALARLAPGARERIALRNRAVVRERADLAANLPRLLDALRHVAACEPVPV